MTVSIILLYIPITSGSAQNQETCAGLEQLARNTNPDLLSNCVRDDLCTQMTCQAAGILNGRLDTVIIMLSPCEMPPGFVVNLVKDGSAILNQLITASMMITYTSGIATAKINVFVNSTTSFLGILV